MAWLGWFGQLSDFAAALPPWAGAAGQAGLALVGGISGAAATAKLLGRDAPAPSERDVVLELSDGTLRARGRAARLWLGGEARPLADLGGRLSLREGPTDLAAACAALEATGTAFEALVETPEGASWMLSGRIEAGRPRLKATPASDAQVKAARLRAALAEAESGRRAAEALLDAAPALLWRRDAEGRIAWANARYRRLAGAAEGAPAPDLRLDSAAEPLGPEPARRAVFRAEDGRRLWHDLSERPAAEAAGLAPGARLGFGSDAAAAVHAEAALRRFVETLTETFAHLRVGLAVFDRNQRLGLFNPAFAELMRLEPSWLAGRPGFNDVLARLRDSRMLPDREDFALWRRQMGELFGDGPARERGDRVETWELPGEVTIRVLARPHPQGAVALLFEDVSETTRLERRWAVESETRRAVMDRLVEGVAAFGPGGEARFANPAFARVWGFRPGRDGERLRFREALARFRAASEPSEAWDRLEEFFRTPENRSPWTDEVRLLNGRLLRARVAALPDGSVLTAFDDVTDRRLVESALRDRNAALEAAEEIRGALIEQISARLGTPLATIAGLSRMLREEAGEGRAARRLVAIAEATEEIRDALGGVLDLASAQSGALPLNPETVHLGKALGAAIEQARSAAERRGVRLAAAAPEATDGDLAAAADAARVRQILFNLLADAVHRAPPGAVVRAGVRRRGRRVEVWADEPAPPHDAPWVAEAEAEAPDTSEPDDPAAALLGFAEPPERFGRPAGALPRRRGLAHALVRRFAELHGGEVRVEAAGAAEEVALEETGDGVEPPLPFESPPPGAPRQRVVCALPIAGPPPAATRRLEAPAAC
ncbi:MAG: PAS-domain containing protein [Paracoccaceae bacterium]